MKMFLAVTNHISHFSLKSVTTQINHSNKAISHQTSDFEHVDHTPSTNLGLEELAVPTNNHSSLSINLNSSHGKIKDLTRVSSKQRQESILTLTGLPKVTHSISMGLHHHLLEPSLFCQKSLDWTKDQGVLNPFAFLVFPVCQPQMVTSSVDAAPLDITEMLSIAEVVWQLFKCHKEKYLVHF